MKRMISGCHIRSNRKIKIKRRVIGDAIRQRSIYIIKRACNIAIRTKGT